VQIVPCKNNDTLWAMSAISKTLASYPENKWTIWAKSLGAFLVGIAGVIVSSLAFIVQRSIADNQRANSLEDLALKQKTYMHQRESDEARLAASLIPFLRCNDDVQRAAALRLLSESAPAQGEHFSEILLQKCTRLSPPLRTEVIRIQEQSRIQQEMDDFSLHLSNARAYKNKGHDGPAARLFAEAGKGIPPRYRSSIEQEELAKARTAFEEGRFSEAADRFVIAFHKVPDIP
jgi:hypothetical protein